MGEPAKILHSADANLAAAIEHYKHGRLAEAEALCADVLSTEPDHPVALNLIGVIVSVRDKTDPDALETAAGYLQRAIAAKPDGPNAHINLGNVRKDQGRLDDAIAAYRAALDVGPDNPLALNNLCVALHENGALEEAQRVGDRVLEIRPDYPEAHNNLANVLKDIGLLAQAAAHYDRAVELKPDLPDAHNGRADVLLRQGRADEAIQAAQRAVELRPDFVEAYNMLGSAKERSGDTDGAIACFQRAVALHPNNAAAHNNLGNMLQRTFRLQAAADCYWRALAIAPDYASAYANLATVLKAQGRFDDAMIAGRRAVELDPDDADAHGNLIFLMDMDPDASFASQQDERRRWNQRHALPLTGRIRQHGNARDADKRLRVGYVSADFRHHSAARSFGSVLLGHDHATFEIVCYADVAAEDDYTERFREAADLWRDASGLDDAALAARIREDEVDILVDLAGHTAGNRLLVFAEKPAPVQVTGWGSGTGTGLAAMDYLMSDATIVRTDEADLLSERAAHLPCYMSYLPPRPAPDVGTLPAAITGHLTFGCFNRLEKLTPATLDLWAGVMRALPEARLILKARELDDAKTARPLLQALVARGIAVQRLEFLGGTGQAEHLNAYNRVDIALDPTPLGGGISTFEALWMGVPVVTLAGRTITSRAGASILTALDLGAWVADTPDRYGEIAAAMSRDLDDLADWRGRLRGLLETSVLVESPRYVRHVEDAYRRMWRRWCEGSGPQHLF